MIPIDLRPRLGVALATLLLLLVPRIAAGQEIACRPWLDGPRIGLATSTEGLRTGSDALGDTCSHADVGALSILPARGLVRFRGAYPYDHADGALWSGRGLSASVAGGVRLSHGPLRITLDPMVTWSQNREFATAGASLRDPYEEIDWPQRPRSGAFATAAWGQSAMRVDAGPAEVSLAAENLWWGPARRYPILLGNSAPGFAHVRVGTRRPLNVGIGRLDVDLLWGRLDESRQFDTLSGNDHRLLTGFFLEFAPKPLPGLSVGIAGVQHNGWADAKSTWADLYAFPFNGDAKGAGNGLVSIMARWRFEESDAEVYGEWARDDYWADLGDLLTEPDHTQGYVLGLEKVVPRGASALRLSWELVHLGNAADYLTGRIQGIAGFYSHGRLTQGHTHQGQLLGAATGPGSNAQFVALERVASHRTVGVYLERIRRDDDAYYTRFAKTYQYTGYDIELTAGLTGEERRGPWHIEWEGVVSRRKNRGFRGMELPDNPYPWHYPVEWDLGFTTRVVWVP